MKKKVLNFAAVVVASALVGGLGAYTAIKLSATQNIQTTSQTQRVYNSGLGEASNHFTSYTAENYPDLTYAAENAVQGVVGVIKTEEIPQMSMQGMPSIFDLFGFTPQGQGQRPQQGEAPKYRQQLSGGSGVIISPDGYIVTNHHVVDNASKLTVKLYDGKTYDATLVGTDADTEIALIKIDASELPSIPFGSSDALRLGEWVLAIGNPYELHSTVTAGIVSAKSRSLGAIGQTGLESFIQTDAAVNPGNSGGALVNTKGELVGINTLIKSPTGSYTGYSFAVPETMVRKIVADLKEYGVVQRALMGVEYAIIDDDFISARGEETGINETGGMYVAGVTPEGGAEQAGIQKGDIITSIDGVTILTTANVAEVISQKRPGDVIKIIAKRDGKVKQFTVTLRNKAGKSELIAKESFDSVKSLGGQFENINLSDKQKKELGIRGGIRVASVSQNGILARARVQRGYIITQINDIPIYSVNDLNKVTDKITSIDGVYPNGRSVTYSLVE
ncbi:MAG: trypsin-like peptidase domain-containing protein [Rikenellaceae bacterium]|jgi:Do/DeqQ family serine protease|nr:trypsin-like peptidase domain-containing protein [Rikenellaceae bacterium]